MLGMSVGYSGARRQRKYAENSRDRDKCHDWGMYECISVYRATQQSGTKIQTPFEWDYEDHDNIVKVHVPFNVKGNIGNNDLSFSMTASALTGPTRKIDVTVEMAMLMMMTVARTLRSRCPFIMLS